MRLSAGTLSPVTTSEGTLDDISTTQTCTTYLRVISFCRILSLALLDELIALDSSSPGGGGSGGGTWMWYISREGYLKNIIETLGEASLCCYLPKLAFIGQGKVTKTAMLHSQFVETTKFLAWCRRLTSATPRGRGPYTLTSRKWRFSRGWRPVWQEPSSSWSLASWLDYQK